jgi:hypothetical protein
MHEGDYLLEHGGRFLIAGILVWVIPAPELTAFLH